MRILAHRGRKQVGALTSAERGKLITAVVCMSAAGNYLPPMLIWPRVRTVPLLMEGAPPGSIAAAHPSGWMQKELFTTWFKHFVHHSHASLQNPVLLLLDGHSTHTQNLELVDLARVNGVHILCLPPCCTHRLQPLDVSFMKPLSVYYDDCIRVWLRNHPGLLVGMFQIAALFRTAYIRAATMQIAINGYRATGIFPYDPHVFQDSDFAGAEATTTDQSGSATIQQPETSNAAVESDAATIQPGTSTVQPAGTSTVAVESEVATVKRKRTHQRMHQPAKSERTHR